MNDWYAGARAFKFHPEFVKAGIVSQAQADEASAMWVDGVERMHTLVKEMPEDAKNKTAPGTRVWVVVGGLNVLSGNTDTKKLFEQINDWIDRIAIGNARERRKAFGWKAGNDNQYLTDPDGNTKPPHGNGMPYGKYTTPSRFRDLGEWDGEIKADTRFTK